MNGTFEFLDYLIFGLYAVTILAIGLWVSRDEDGKQKNAEDYFLASKSLPWWAVGTSLIAANFPVDKLFAVPFTPSTPPNNLTLLVFCGLLIL